MSATHGGKAIRKAFRPPDPLPDPWPLFPIEVPFGMTRALFRVEPKLNDIGRT